jgi:hypothetical protein
MRYLKYTMPEVGFRPRRSQMRLPLQVHAFRRLLVQETDETKRQMLFLSLAQEEVQLKALMRALSAKCGREPAGSSVRPLVGAKGLGSPSTVIVDSLADQA